MEILAPKHRSPWYRRITILSGFLAAAIVSFLLGTDIHCGLPLARTTTDSSVSGTTVTSNMPSSTPPNQSIGIEYGYSKDETHIYSYGQIVPGADPHTFRIIAASKPREGPVYFFTADATHVFLNDQLIDGADSTTFQVKSLYGGIGMDKNSVYLGQQKVDAADPGSFWLPLHPNGSYPDNWKPDVCWTWGEDNEKVFVFDICSERWAEIKGADVSSFAPLVKDGTFPYSKDYSRVYIEERIIDGADPATFAVATDTAGGAMDKNHVYQWGVPQRSTP